MDMIFSRKQFTFNMATILLITYFINSKTRKRKTLSRVTDASGRWPNLFEGAVHPKMPPPLPRRLSNSARHVPSQLRELLDAHMGAEHF
ncbi:hypothetical protein PQR71_35135 [Paraburkholderia fungorum]|uniref:hypothetical protein n=1 Tax=Paraburkholderia fungorum TaxID=134537 RepID=UPI0038BA6FFD